MGVCADSRTTLLQLGISGAPWIAAIACFSFRHSTVQARDVVSELGIAGANHIHGVLVQAVKLNGISEKRRKGLTAPLFQQVTQIQEDVVRRTTR